MPAKGKKSLPIDQDVHHEIKLEAAARGLEMGDLIRQMWEEFKQRHGSAAEILRKSLGQQGHPEVHKGGRRP
jgi:hypothetical protein